MNSSHQVGSTEIPNDAKISTRDLLNPCLDPSFLKIELFESCKFFLDAFISFLFFFLFESSTFLPFTIYIVRDSRISNGRGRCPLRRRRRRRRKTIEFTPELDSFWTVKFSFRNRFEIWFLIPLPRLEKSDTIDALPRWFYCVSDDEAAYRVDLSYEGCRYGMMLGRETGSVTLFGRMRGHPLQEAWIEAVLETPSLSRTRWIIKENGLFLILSYCYCWKIVSFSNGFWHMENLKIDCFALLFDYRYDYYNSRNLNIRMLIGWI